MSGVAAARWHERGPGRGHPEGRALPRSRRPTARCAAREGGRAGDGGRTRRVDQMRTPSTRSRRAPRGPRRHAGPPRGRACPRHHRPPGSRSHGRRRRAPSRRLDPSVEQVRQGLRGRARSRVADRRSASRGPAAGRRAGPACRTRGRGEDDRARSGRDVTEDRQVFRQRAREHDRQVGTSLGRRRDERGQLPERAAFVGTRADRRPPPAPRRRCDRAAGGSSPAGRRSRRWPRSCASRSGGRGDERSATVPTRR